MAIRRITIDTKRVMELAPLGLHWVPDEMDIAHGWATIFGPTDTPYYGGAFSFEVRFPDNYPFEPPSFAYLTNDGRTRFNPNLYKNGKVCLSLLNTWAGEQWSGVQSLGSILQSIQTAVLIEEPLRNEPAYSAMSVHTDIPIYNRLVFHAVIETAILGSLAEVPMFIVQFLDEFLAHVRTARPAILAKARALAAEWDGKVEQLQFYGMATKYRFGDLADRLSSLA
jgi:ubiquitin-conjugating enzyme E2 Z